MRVLLLSLLLSFAAAQDKPLEWKQITEMSGEIPGQSALTVNVYAAQIARGDNMVKLLLKAEFPDGAPYEIFKNNAPRGFDVTSINKMMFKMEFDCDTLVMKTVKNSGEVYQFNGKHFKTKEMPFSVDAGNIFVKYFCERGEAPTKAPTLKPKSR